MTFTGVRSSTAQAMTAWFDRDMLCIRLIDGRELGVPLEWFPTLAHATPEQLNHWIVDQGYGIWPDRRRHPYWDCWPAD
jgi:hypothetical protein